jgi:hypothetical protein
LSSERESVAAWGSAAAVIEVVARAEGLAAVGAAAAVLAVLLELGVRLPAPATVTGTAMGGIGAPEKLAAGV